MKKIFTIFALIVALVSNVLADDKADSTYTAGWTYGLVNNIPMGRVNNPALNPTENKQAYIAKLAQDLDPGACNFDQVWNSSTYNPYSIANNTATSTTHTGDDDFKGAFKAFYDGYNVYVFLKFTDDNITGNEKVEIPWATYFKLHGKTVTTTNPQGTVFEHVGAWYLRYAAFGSYKATFTKTGYVDVMKIDFASPTAQGVVTWNGTNENLTSNLFVNDKSVAGSGEVKWIITLGFNAFKSVGFENETFPLPRPDFNEEILKAMNGKKGLSFDIKVKDDDGTGATGEYWWNSTSNDCWQVTWYAGFLGVEQETAIKNTFAQNSIFRQISKKSIELSELANVTIYTSTGLQIKSLKMVNTVNITNLPKGLYVVKANNQTIKITK